MILFIAGQFCIWLIRSSTSEKDTFEKKLLPILMSALSPIGQNTKPSNSSTTLEVPCTAADEQQPLVKHVATIVAESRNLLNEYKAIASQPIRPSRLPNLNQAIHQEKERTTDAVKAGRQLAARDIDILMADKHHEIRGRSGITAEDEEQGRRLLRQGRKEDGKEHEHEGRWGSTAYDLKKAVLKLSDVALDLA